MELAEGAQRYVDELAQMDSQAKQNAIRTDVNEFKVDHFEELVTGLVKRVCEELNDFLAAKGQSIQPRLSLSMKGEHKNKDEDDDYEVDSEPRVKREKN